MSFHAIAFIIIYGIGIVATLLGGPFYGLLTYLFEYYNHPPIYWWGEELPNLRYSFIISIVLLVSFLLRWEKYSYRKVLDVPQTKWLLLFFGVMVAISPIAIVPGDNNEYILRYFKLVILYLLIIKIVRTQREFDLFAWVHILGCFHLGWQAFEDPRREGGKLYGIGTPDAHMDNHLVGILESSIPFIAFFFFFGKKWEKILALIAVPFVLNAIILCNSRGATIGLLAAGLSWLGLMYLEKIKGLKWKTLISIVAGSLLFLSLVDAEFIERFSTLKDPSKEGAGKRIGIWLGGVEMMKDYPLGTGGGGFDFLSSKGYIPEDLLYEGTGARGAHSTYVLVAVEQGIIGFILFLTFVGVTFRGLHRQRASLRNDPEFIPFRVKSIALESAMISLLVGGIFLSRFYSETLYWFYGLAASLYQMSYQKTASPEKQNSHIVFSPSLIQEKNESYK